MFKENVLNGLSWLPIILGQFGPKICARMEMRVHHVHITNFDRLEGRYLFEEIRARCAVQVSPEKDSVNSGADCLG